MLRGPPMTEAELLAALEWAVRRHPLLRAVVVGRGKFVVPGAQVSSYTIILCYFTTVLLYS